MTRRPKPIERLRARTTAIIHTPARTRQLLTEFNAWRRNGCPNCGYRPEATT